jgi:hypothetical protein
MARSVSSEFGEATRVYEAYLAMADRARYRPAAPSDGWGNIQLTKKQIYDRRRLTKEAVAYANRFIVEEDGGAFNIGVSNFRTNRALVYVIEAARCLCGGADDVAATLLKMASDEIDNAR